MLGFIQKFFGGSKSEKDVKIIQPLVGQINQHFNSFQSLSNDQLRSKTQDFRERIKAHLSQTDRQKLHTACTHPLRQKRRRRQIASRHRS